MNINRDTEFEAELDQLLDEINSVQFAPKAEPAQHQSYSAASLAIGLLLLACSGLITLYEIGPDAQRHHQYSAKPT